MAVIEPTGSSALDTNVLANVSAISKKNAPKKIEKIKTCLLFPITVSQYEE